MKKILLLLMLLLSPSICLSDEYVLVMSKDDSVCTHMLKVYNDDINKFRRVMYENHKEYNWIKWKYKLIRIKPSGEPSTIEDMNAMVEYFDINNDLVNDVVIHSKSRVSNHSVDNYDIFNINSFSMLNGIVNGYKYYLETLKSISSDQGIFVNVYDINEDNFNKLPERTREMVIATKKGGNKNLYFIGNSLKINFLKYEGKFYVDFEGPRDIGPHENFKTVEHYGIIASYQKDYSIDCQCLYLIKQDKSNKRRSK